MSQKAEFLKERLAYPAVDVANHYIKKFNKEQNLNEESVKKAFSLDNSLESILVKVILLNNRYSAGLNDNKPKVQKEKKLMPDVRTVADRIHDFEDNHRFDKCQNTDDVIKLVKDFRDSFKGYRQPYSFITKYCSFRLPEIDVPIADGYVKGLLYYYDSIYEFYKKKFDLDDYKSFCDVYNAFKTEYLNGLSIKDIDKYLWLYAKEKEQELALEYKNMFGVNVFSLSK